MPRLRIFTKEFRLYATREIATSEDVKENVVDACYIAHDGEAYRIIIEKVDLKDSVIAKYREIFPGKLAIHPDFPDFAEGYMVERLDDAPQNYIDKLFEKEVKQTLEEELKSALDNEDYAEAARIRDKINRQKSG